MQVEGSSRHNCNLHPNRRSLLTGVAAAAMLPLAARASAAQQPELDLAVVATPCASSISGGSAIDSILRAEVPAASNDMASGMWAVWYHPVAQWLELSWPSAITTDRIELYWGDDGEVIGLPSAARLLYWNGGAFVPVAAQESLGVAGNRFNSLTFAPIRTERLRLEIEPGGKRSIGVRRWRVRPAGTQPVLPAVVDAGIDRSVVLGGSTYLSAQVGRFEAGKGDVLRWNKESGPGEATFEDATAAKTRARFSEIGEYVLRVTTMSAGKPVSSRVRVRVVAPPPERRLNVVYTTPYAVDNPLWNGRVKALIVNWIPHCIAYCERTDLPTGQGGIDNFVEAAKALCGEEHGAHKGYVFSNAWVHQTVESMCLALMIDAGGDPEILSAQDHMRSTLERWIPIILAAQEPDGYLQTAFTLADRKTWPERWIPAQRTGHEGYVAGYFIESAINHHTLTGGRDLRLYDAAKKLADCWVAHIGPGKKRWFDGHQEMEQALVRFGRFVNDMEGNGRGDAYVALARFLIDSREGGTRYDQSHVPATQQYEAVGHAVRAMYFYSGMADVAAETGDVDYQSAVASLWDNMVNRRYYVTGGVGSGDTAEGFGEDYGLRHDAYCESCSSCGLIFFQYKMNLAYHEARYVDLYEETMYNALLGGVALDGRSFCYTNPLAGTERARWHSCPCCVGNIPRTLLMLPTWAYAKGDHSLFVNLFVGSRIDVGDVGGTPVEVVQITDYPWSGDVSMMVNPKKPTTFALHVRVPDRTTSALYTATPAVNGLARLTVNGTPMPFTVENGYAVIRREWTAGDRVAFELPLKVQRVLARDEVSATRGQVALRYGPIVYSAERADQPDVTGSLGRGELKASWRRDLLGGVMTVDGHWADGSSFRAVPYYARMNRIDGPIRDFPIADGAIDPAGATVLQNANASKTSRVWLKV